MSTDFIVFSLAAGVIAIIQAALTLMPWPIIKGIGRVLGGASLLVLGVTFWSAAINGAPPACAIIAICFGLSGLASIISGVLELAKGPRSSGSGTTR